MRVKKKREKKGENILAGWMVILAVAVVSAAVMIPVASAAIESSSAIFNSTRDNSTVAAADSSDILNISFVDDTNETVWANITMPFNTSLVFNNLINISYVNPSGETDTAATTVSSGAWGVNVTFDNTAAANNLITVNLNVTARMKGNYSINVTTSNIKFSIPITIERGRVLNENTSVYYSTIQGAVDEASAGDTIFVYAGTYEDIEISKDFDSPTEYITIEGENKEKTIINGQIHVPPGIAKMPNAVIKNFTIQGSVRGIYFERTYPSFFRVEDCIIKDNDYGIYVVDCVHSDYKVQIKNCEIYSNTKAGVYIRKSRYFMFDGNHIYSNEDGFYSYADSYYHKILNNIVENNARYGIRLYWRSSHCTVVGNTVMSNKYGISLTSESECNSIYHNNIIGNSDYQAIDGCMGNKWDDGYPSGGNYWSDYTGDDKFKGPGQDLPGSDGIGDVPYKIDADSIDHYPLMEPYGVNKPPVASFTYTPEKPVVNQTIEFDASSSYDSDGTITTYEWDFGDGDKATGGIVTHSYSSEGEYTVTLTVTDNSSLTNSTTRKIKVIKEGIPNIAWNMTISATNQLEPVVVGMHPNATDGYDADFDAFAQTPVQGKVILILDDIYSTSIKKTRCYNESVSWNLSVGVPTGETATLSWDAPPNVNLTITKGSNILYSGIELSEGSHELLVTAKLMESTTFSLKLEPGWNMVSLPLVPDNSSVYAVFGSIPTLDTMPVVTWEAPSFVVVEEIEPKIGYWVFTPAETTINVTGKPITNTTLILEAGWNMVGTAGMENLTISDIPNQVPQRPAVTWVAPSFVKTDVIEPGKSAWVFVTTDTIVTMGKAFSGEMKVKAVPTITKKKSVITPATTEEWNLTISATNQLEPVTLGIRPDATNGYDVYDVFAQTPVQEKVIMILDKIYATEINKDKLTWNLSVGVPAGQTTTLTWDSSKIPADVSLTLDGIDMKLQNSIELGEGSHSFVINGTTGEPTAIFDTGAPSNPYPSISGTHTGDIIPSQDIAVHKIYTYPCAGTGGHTEYVRIWNDTWPGKEAHWSGYQHDWYNITFDEPFTLFAKRTYHYEIITGSYPQIIHKPEHTTLDGSYINCTSFVDANGKTYTDWIPAIRIYTRYL